MLMSTEVPNTISEYAYAGAMVKRRIPVVRGQVTGLPMPAFAEVVAEGWITPDQVLTEGPFGEWYGYYGSDVRDEPVMDIKAIYHRNDPIILGCPPQRPPDELAR